MPEDPELERLRRNEAKACALRDRLRQHLALVSDPVVLERAEKLCREARAAIDAHLATRDAGRATRGP